MPRLSLPLAFVAAVLTIAALAAPTQRARKPPTPRRAPAQPAASRGGAPREFLFGCEWPVDGSQAVKDLFYETGCNYARITGGGYGWATEGHKRALAELKAHGVKAIVQLGSHYPDGHYFAFKDSTFVDQAGATGKEDRNAWAITYDGQAWPQYSYASERFRQELEKDFSAYLGALKGADNIAGLLLHNEAGYFWLSDRLFDYNPAAVARFRKWLASQHGSIQALNERWGASYASFDAVEPPHDLPPVRSVAAWLDWRRFQVTLIQDFLQWERDFARRVRPGVPCTTNLATALDNWYPFRSSDPFRFTQPMDVAGIDIYPGEWSSRYYPGYAMDTTLGVAQGRPAQVLECDAYSAEKYPALTGARRSELLRSTVWTYIGHGAAGVLIWTLSGQQGFALTRGEYNPLVGAVREVAHTARMLRLGEFRKPARQVAVVVDPDAVLYYGGLKPKLEGATQACQSIEGLYAAVVSTHHEADVVYADQVRAGVGRRYKALYLATPVLMDAGLAAQLKEFVRGGGMLVAQAPFAELDRWGRALPSAPGLGLAEVFGLTAREPDAAAAAPGRGWEVDAPSRRVLALSGARVLGKFADGKPVVTANRFGKGTAIYVAQDLGTACSHGLQIVQRGGMGAPALAAIEDVAQVTPLVARTDAGGAYLDCTTLDDARGNRLVVVANPPDHGKPLAPVSGARLSVAVPGRGPLPQVFTFPETAQQATRVVAGPRRLWAAAEPGGRCALSLPDVSSALPVLLARDAPPLLAVNAPAAAHPGNDVTVWVTCYNPSPRRLVGRAGIGLPAGWKAPAAAPVSIAPGGEQTLTFRLQVGAAGRAVVRPWLDTTGGRQRGVPVDMAVTD